MEHKCCDLKQQHYNPVTYITVYFNCGSEHKLKCQFLQSYHTVYHRFLSILKIYIITHETIYLLYRK